MNPLIHAATLLSALLPAVLLTSAPPASAHSASTAYLDVARDGTATTLHWRVALRDLDLLLDLDADRDGRLQWREVAARSADLVALAQTSLRLDGGCTSAFDPPAFQRDGELGYALLVARSDCAPRRLDYRLFDGVDPTHRLLVKLSSDAPRVLAPGQSLELADPAAAAPPSFGAFVHEGVQHILGGFDHLLFLVALMLPALLARHDGRWRARTDRRRALLQVAWIATAFTAAHSITLAIATFGWLRVPPSIIEPLVALTVLAAALNNLWPLVATRLAAVAFGFGLIHGFAFAEVLAPLQLPRADLARALLGFNLGVEAGQLAVIGASFALLALAVRWRGYPRWVLQGGSAAVALLAGAWIVERTFAVALLP